MTLIVGVDYFYGVREILVMADTRVSANDESGYPPRDQLQKMIFVDYFGRMAILGFSGNLQAVKKIAESLQIYAKCFRSFGSLKDDMKAWIEDIVRSEHKQSSLQFMLCDFNPMDKTHIHTYNVLESGKVHLQSPGMVGIIGSGRELRHRILKTTVRSFGNPKGYKDLEAYSKVRTLMAANVVATEFQLMHSRKVGGPFMIVRIRPDGLVGPHYMWPPFDDTSDVQQYMDGNKVILYKPSTGEKYTLFSIYEYSDADFYQHSDACAQVGLRSSF